MTEEWKDIWGYEGKYQVSNLGQVRNESGLIMKTRRGWNGERSIQLSKNGKQIQYYVRPDLK